MSRRRRQRKSPFLPALLDAPSSISRSRVGGNSGAVLGLIRFGSSLGREFYGSTGGEEEREGPGEILAVWNAARQEMRWKRAPCLSRSLAAKTKKGWNEWKTRPKAERNEKGMSRWIEEERERSPGLKK
ncbi:hypothetical protein M431DRAFT_510475 [Trichoderma harzianum CBS 226.95]|uniref:Uncharacterized protein n=1 Tax=Trichoderma harzianum CBS 226.95 TaxID=983964 RepID=A0A2T4A5E5_TRIHA|nr:hypothetical protein M431DRAFT_510475 [Trichoderma harzianum CBS 226.95]PTB52289.1 hypothetical protein M431DRAFT_510475 [Trichoderma harzianum CBS 226.95]